MSATEAAPSSRKGFYEWALIGALVFMAIDVVCLFIGGALHWDPMLNAALGTFVYIQMAMTGASLLSIPVTIFNSVRKRIMAG